VTLKETIIERNCLSLVPFFLNFSGAEIEFSGLAGREFYLARFFYKAKKGIIMNKKTL